MFLEKLKLNNLFMAFTAEVVVTFLAVFNIIPREAVLFLTGLLVFYFLFAPFRDVTLLFILSIPLFVALPVSVGFDAMANWRLLLAILFFRKLVVEMRAYKWSLKDFIRDLFKEKIYVYAALFFLVALVSLIGAESLSFGLRKIIFLVNIGMLFFVLVPISKNLLFEAKPRTVKRVMSYSVSAVLISLIVGYGQLLAVFFIPLFFFWQFWAGNVISVFYGEGLAGLLSYSNTWFSYSEFENVLPTLRIFSVFPDSHSFALFSLIGLMPVTYLWLKDKKNKGNIILGILLLLSIILSGSRGFWASALMVGALIGATYVIRRFVRFLQGKQLKLKKFVVILLVFFMLFPLGSLILSGSRIGNMPRGGGDFDFWDFKRVRSIVDFEETSNKGRLEIWKYTWESFKQQPMLGVGIGNYAIVLDESIEASRRGASAHNLYFDFAAEMGLLGLAMFLLILWEVLKKAWNIYVQKKDVFGIVFIFYFLWILAYNLFDVVLLNDKVLLLFMAQVAVLWLIEGGKGKGLVK